MFNPEKSILKWRKSLYRNPGLEDGMIEELESHLREEIERLIGQGLDAKSAFERASREIGPPPSIAREYRKTDARFLAPAELDNPRRFSPALAVNEFKLGLRRMRRHRGYALINIAGLAAGIACCLFILLYIQFQLSFDHHYPGVDRIFIIGNDVRTENGRSLSPGGMPLIAPTLQERFPQLEAVGRFNQGWIDQVSRGEKVFKEEALWTADTGLLEVLSIPFIQGDRRTALDNPNTAVITEDMADKYFGRDNPMGQILKIGEKEYEITGVVRNPPANTDFPYKIIMSWKTVENEEHWSGWNILMGATACLVRLRPDGDPDRFEAAIRDLPREFCARDMEEKGMDARLFLLNIRDIHRKTFGGPKLTPSSAMVYVWIFSAVGMLILLIAGMNYMNLATARSAGRAAEVGMRKVVGAGRRQLIRQFLGESFFTTAIAMALALVLVQIFLPAFNRLAQTEFTSGNLIRPAFLLGLTGMLLIVGAGAGSYPAFVLSSFPPLAALRRRWGSGSRGKVMRQTLVISQFTISIALIIASLIIARQIRFMKNQPLGFDKDRKLVIQLKGWRMITENYEAVKSEFLRHPAVLNATASSGTPGTMINRTWVYPPGRENTEGAAFRSLRCDHDFTRVYGLELAAGRPFDKTIASDTLEAFLLNETGARAFGWSPEEAVGEHLWTQNIPVVGVVKDYHWWGLQRRIEPMIMRVVPELFRSLTLTVDTAGLPETLGFLEKTYARLFPGDLFEYAFLDGNFDRQYRTEARIGHIFRIFTILGIFIACLGLFGLASFITEQRTKEIGIRKVLGASTPGLVLLLSREFTKWVLAANLIAWPLAYYAGRHWLRNFAYRASIGPELFVFAGLLTLAVALASVLYQALRSAASDPVECLRYE